MIPMTGSGSGSGSGSGDESTIANPDGRFQRVLGNLQNQRFSICEQIQKSFVEEQDIREVLAEFWTPSLQVLETAKRIRSSSMDEPKPPDVSDSVLIDELFNELGCNPSEIVRHLQLIDELIPEKIMAMKLIEANLKEIEKTISRYQAVMKEFQEKFSDLQQLIGIPIFLQNGRHNGHDGYDGQNGLIFKDSILEYCRSKHLPELLRRYQQLKFQVEYCRLPFEYLKKKTSHAEAPNCNICLTRPISIAITPCGHTMCDTCCKTIHVRGKCPFCRHTISEFFKIYM
jgi:hypothetical protein